MHSEQYTTQPISGLRLISRRLLKEKLGDVRLSDTTLWRMVKRGEIPPPIRISAGRVAWIESEVDHAIAIKAAQRNYTPEAA